MLFMKNAPNPDPDDDDQQYTVCNRCGNGYDPHHAGETPNDDNICSQCRATDNQLLIDSFHVFFDHD